ncbi:MAG: hypothetical protein V7629_10645 [Motiliproteus sp.]
MFIVLKQGAYFARQHAQPLLFIAVLLSLPGWAIEYLLSSPAVTPEAEADIQGLGASMLLVVMAVIQFAAAMIYIHQQVLGRPISALQAISLGVSRLGPLLLINILMSLAIGIGLVLLILPGLYMAYKLLFGEFYLLFHGQRSLQALRCSYRDNTDLSDKLLPPLLCWGGLVGSVSIGQLLLLDQGMDPLLINLVFEAATLALMLWGWAIMYRLYQLYIEPLSPPHTPASAAPEQRSAAETKTDRPSAADHTDPEPPKQE